MPIDKRVKSAAEAVGRSIDIIVPPDRRAEVHNILDRVGRGERIERYETVRVHKDNREVEVSLSVSPIRSASGDIVGASKTARDITKTNRTQKALNQEIEERRRIFETSHDLILVTDTAGNFVQVSPSALTTGVMRACSSRINLAARSGVLSGEISKPDLAITDWYSSSATALRVAWEICSTIAFGVAAGAKTAVAPSPDVLPSHRLSRPTHHTTSSRHFLSETRR